MWFVSGLIIGLCYGFMIWSQSRRQYEGLHNQYIQVLIDLKLTKQQQRDEFYATFQRRQRSLN